MGGREFILVSGDRLLVHHREANVVESLDQAPLAELVELESDHPAVGAADFLRRQVNGDGGVGAALRVVMSLAWSSTETLTGKIPLSRPSRKPIGR
jgi:hypothetical protein